MQSSVVAPCDGYKKFSDIKGPLRPDPDFRCARCLGTAWHIIGRTVKEVRVDGEKLKAVPKLCYLGGGGGRGALFLNKFMYFDKD